LSLNEWLFQMVLITFVVFQMLAHTSDATVMTAKLHETPDGPRKTRAAMACFCKFCCLLVGGASLMFVMISQGTVMDLIGSMVSMELVINLPKIYIQVKQAFWIRGNVATYMNGRDEDNGQYRNDFQPIFDYTVTINEVSDWREARKEVWFGPVPVGVFMVVVNSSTFLVVLICLSRCPWLHDYLWWSSWEANNKDSPRWMAE